MFKVHPDFDKAIKLNPEISEFYIHRVDILLKKNLYSKALSDFDKIISLEPKSKNWFLRRGLLKIKQLKYDFQQQHKKCNLHPHLQLQHE